MFWGSTFACPVSSLLFSQPFWGPSLPAYPGRMTSAGPDACRQHPLISQVQPHGDAVPIKIMTLKLQVEPEDLFLCQAPSQGQGCCSEDQVSLPQKAVSTCHPQTPALLKNMSSSQWVRHSIIPLCLQQVFLEQECRG